MTDEEAAREAARLLGRRGGEKRRDQIGSAGYQEIGKQGGAETAKRHGREHYQKIGKKGGQANAQKGTEHFQAIGRRGGDRVRALIEAGKRALEQAGQE